ncbi:MAG: hypothetical protein LBH94_00900 [Deltaproteobacteria bacterium]|jgi:hypothetical protein|nr:hypothetical protein [Deltaproteobacteria bacterium]
MKKLVLVLMCSLVCATCAKKSLTTLSDGKPGYAVHCETYRQRCLDENARLCSGTGYKIIKEKADEWSLPDGWPEDSGAVYRFNSRYWMEVRCEP